MLNLPFTRPAKSARRAIHLLWVFLLTLSIVGTGPIHNTQAQSNGAVLPEGNDYATKVFGRPWDMSDYAQVSTYINRSGQANLIADINVSNGIFSGRSLEGQASIFTLLFPAYYTGVMKVGKIGYNYPIDPATYHCIYAAARIDSQRSTQPDQMFFWWQANNNLDVDTKEWGTLGIPTSDTPNQPNPRWKLYRWDLAQGRASSAHTPWNRPPYGNWQGLAISPSLQDTTWQFDWVRLTDCNSSGRTLALTWSGGSAPYAVSVVPEGTSRDILIDGNVSSRSYTLDTQGLQAGRYTYVVRSGTNVLTSGTFTVVAAPITTFTRPSPTSGVDYATQQGTPWDMSNANSVTGLDCYTSASFRDGLLHLVTPPAARQTGNCYGGGWSNVAVRLRTPVPIDTTVFRYLTFRMNLSPEWGPWQNIPSSTIIRWIWFRRGYNNPAGDHCILISAVMPLDVGWHTYTIDLWDADQGKVDDSSVNNCPPQPWSWRTTGPAYDVHMKTSENGTNFNLTQQLDWVRLTTVDAVRRGTMFPIQFSFNKAMDADQVTLYYTTNRANPTMNRIRYTPRGLPNAAQRLFVPFLANSSSSAHTFFWDTSAVANGEYYICAAANDGFNQTTFCSDAPVRIVP